MCSLNSSPHTTTTLLDQTQIMTQVTITFLQIPREFAFSVQKYLGRTRLCEIVFL